MKLHKLCTVTISGNTRWPHTVTARIGRIDHRKQGTTHTRIVWCYRHATYIINSKLHQ